ncbi:MAG: SCP2 sterol-binding domain-containing protein [Candidatus Freyarchaeum deiterrae]
MIIEGVTRDVIKEIVDAMVVVFNNREPEFKEKMKSVTKGKRKVYRFDVTDIDLKCDVELTPEGDVVVHYDNLQNEEPDLMISSETVVFDGVMTQRVSPVAVFLKRKAKVKGSIRELNKFRPIIPEMSVSYKKARAHIAEKHGLQEALKKLDETKI